MADRENTNNKLLKRLIVVSILFVLIVGVVLILNNRKENKENLAFINEINEERIKENENKINIPKVPSLSIDNPLTEEEINSLLLTKDKILLLRGYERRERNKIGKREAIEDINLAFKALKYGYGGYDHFGGDTTFNKVRDDLINEINKKNDLTISDIRNMLTSSLLFIKDNHFMIVGTHIFNEKYNYYYNNNYEITKKDGRYLIKIGNEDFNINKVNASKNIEDYIFPTLNSKGNISYELGIFSKDTEFTLEVYYESKSDLKKLKIDLKKSLNIKNRYNKTDSDIGYIKIDNFISENDNLIKKTNEIKDKKVNILDLRGNLGGSEFIAKKWYEVYFGESPSRNANYIFKHTNLIKEANLNSYPQREFDKEINTIELISEEGKIVDNDKYLLVLVDNEVASAAEGLCTYLRTVKNVIFIGTNTSGTTKVMDRNEFILPNTSIGLSFGPTAFYYTPFEIEEGRGISPDIWVGSEDVIDRVVMFARNLN